MSVRGHGTYLGRLAGILAVCALAASVAPALHAEEATTSDTPQTPATQTAEEEQAATETLPGVISLLATDVDTLWVCLAAFLVFFMQAGFALVETGFTRAKNA